MHFLGGDQVPVIKQLVPVTFSPAQNNSELSLRKITLGLHCFNVNGHVMTGKHGVEMRRQMVVPIDKP